VLTSGTVIVSGSVTNSGTLVASGSGSLITIAAGATVNSGAVEIANGVVSIASGGAANIDFLANDSGGLLLSGTGKLDTNKAISGFGSGATVHTDHAEYIDFTSINFTGATVSYTSATGNSSGTLIVSSGGKTASVTLIGSYSAGNFSSASLSGTLEITDPAAVAQGGTVQSANIALFGNYIAGSFVTAAGGQGGSVVSTTSQGEPPLLTHPHG
jgi:hypothetical protein